ncbi:MAG: orotidine-5'-phosphate decarboxylase [Magnetococcus sp. YQC-3]
MSGFADRLIERAQRIQSRVIVGLDPMLEAFPAHLQAQLRAHPTEEQLEEVIVAFNRVVIEATLADAVAYKPQAAFYEQYGLAGMRALLRTIGLLHDRGQIVIMDAKRNDVAHTAGAYATAWLAPLHPWFATPNPWRVEAITLNGYLGSDGIRPFQEANADAGLFILVKTSNPSSGELQDQYLWAEEGGKGGTVAEKMAGLVHQWGQANDSWHGFSNVGMVVGATYPAVTHRLRQAAPRALFLMPGIGVQGGSLEAIVAGAGAGFVGAYAASSRGLLYPFLPEALAGADWPDRAAGSITEAARSLRQAIQEKLKKAGMG